MKPCIIGVLNSLLGKDTLSSEDSAKRQYYYKLLMAWVMMFVCSVFALIVFRQWELILFALALGIVLFGVMLSYEYKNQQNDYLYVYAYCTEKGIGKKKKSGFVKVREAAGQMRYIYKFDGKTTDGKEFNFNLTLPQSFGVEEETEYLMTFDAKTIDDISENNLVTYGGIKNEPQKEDSKENKAKRLDIIKKLKENNVKK